VKAFERTAIELPRYAPAHAGLANAYLLQYERTRFGSSPDRSLIARAMKAARQATTLDASLGEGWAVLGYLLCAAGKMEEGQAAARRATALEPENWRHHYRLAYGSWGEERLRAVDRTLAIMPGFAPARMLSAMVFVARGTVERAERETAIGAETQRQNQTDQTPLPAVGFHWLRGMILASKGDRTGAVACYEEELASAAGHVYGREFALNAQVALGFSRLHEGDRDGASAAFTAAITHPKSRVGMCAINRDAQEVETAIAELTKSERHAEAALVRAGSQIVGGAVDQAVATLDRLLTSAPPGPTGWIIPIDPMLAAIDKTPGKAALFAKLAARAA
jgi:tetratricopeptide (TPR) repeat protein